MWVMWTQHDAEMRMEIKGALCSLGEEMSFFFSSLIKQIDHKTTQFILSYFVYVADPATFLGSHSVLAFVFLWTACLYTFGKQN